MSTPYLGEVRIFAFNFPPRGWVFCNGQIMAISQNQALFSLLGTTYGGDGIQTFAVPNLQGAAPLHFGLRFESTFQLGQTGGETSHTTAISEMPAHAHALGAFNGPGTQAAPAGNYLASHRGGYADASAAAVVRLGGCIGLLHERQWVEMITFSAPGTLRRMPSIIA